MSTPEPAVPPSGFDALTSGSRWADVQAFVDSLAALPLTAWLRIGANILRSRDGIFRRAGAGAIVEAVLADRHLITTAWLVRDAVDTACLLVSRSTTMIPRSQRRLFDAARSAAQNAALALAVADYLPARDLRALREPFVF